MLFMVASRVLLRGRVQRQIVTSLAVSAILVIVVASRG